MSEKHEGLILILNSIFNYLEDKNIMIIYSVPLKMEFIIEGEWVQVAIYEMGYEAFVCKIKKDNIDSDYLKDLAEDLVGIGVEYNDFYGIFDHLRNRCPTISTDTLNVEKVENDVKTCHQ